MARAVDQPGKALGERRALYNGFGNALAHAVELALTPVLFALAGLWLDHRFGTGRVLTVVLFLFAVAGLAARAYYGYLAEVDEAEKGMPWKRTR